MAEFIFAFVAAAIIFVLAMRRAPLRWAAAIALLTFACSLALAQASCIGLPSSSGRSWLADRRRSVRAHLPRIKRNYVVLPAYRALKGAMPTISDTEHEALEAGTIGFDAELFSGTPDWEKLRAVAADHADAGGAGVPRRPDRRAVPHGQRLEDPPRAARDPRGDLGLRPRPRLPRHAHLQGARRAWASRRRRSR